jgi:hypothetical protein
MRSSSGRRGEAGVSEVVLDLPHGVAEGCFVPVYARTGRTVSNVVTVAIARALGPCAAEPDWPRPAARGATLLLTRFSLLLELRPGDPEASDEETADAVFLSASTPAVLPLHILPPPGACVGVAANLNPGGVAAALAAWALGAAGGQGIDAGPEIVATGASGARRMLAGAPGVYGSRTSRRAPQAAFAPGQVRIAAAGGPGAGAFSATLRASAPLAWTNRERSAAIDRAQGATVEWANADPARPVLILAAGADRLSAAGYACLCTAPAGSTRFALPAAMLANIPPTRPGAGPPAGLLLVMQSPRGGQATFPAKGIDAGAALFVAGSGRSLTYLP